MNRWPCGHALHSATEAAECAAYARRDARHMRWFAMFFFLVIAAILVGVELGRAAWIYGDWRCAFADCRIVVVSPAQ